jgi:pyruvate dehydrogenase (quinone)/pyruvate oxidase
MAQTTADVIVETILEWGVDTIFGIPGDGINGIIESLRVREDRIRFIQVRHEEAAAFMACAWSKFTGRLGCCIATSGPGGIHLLNGLYDAKLDGASVLAITGLQFHDLINTHTQQDVELDKLFIDVAIYNARIMGPSHAENVTNMACRSALAYKGVAHITIPVDIQDMTAEKRSKRNIEDHVSEAPMRSARKAADADIQRSAAILNEGKKVVILAGRGALDATDELIEVSERLGAPIIKALLGKACVPDDDPHTTGGIGLLGTRPSLDAMESCDTILIAGSAFPYIEFMPKPGQARGVQIDLNPVKIGVRYPVEIGLVADTGEALRQLIPHLKRKEDRSFLGEAQAGMRDWNNLMNERASFMEKPMKPQVIASELGKRLRNDAIVCCDSGTVTTWFARHIPAKRGQMHSLSGTLATMACGLPYSIAAQLAFPDRQVIAFVGDGALTMLMGELATAVKYKLPIKVFVVKNDSLGQIRWEQMVFLGNPEYVCDLQPIDFVKIAEACGAKGISVDDPKQAGDAVERALSAPGPVVVEAVVDTNEPPMPAKISADQAKHFAESLLRGTPDRANIVSTVLKDKIRELV